MIFKNKMFILMFFVLCQFSFSQKGENLFDDSFIHKIEINSIQSYTYDQFHDTLYNSHNNAYYTPLVSSLYYKASLKIDGTILDTVGVRYKGVSTFENARSIGKYAIKIDVNEYVSGQKIDGIKKINLNNNLLDVSAMRSKLAYETLQRMKIVAPRTAYAKVYINGDYRGLYTMVEQIDKTFIKSNFDSTNVGLLHKAQALTVGLRTATFGGQDTTIAGIKFAAPLKTKKSTDNYQPLKDFILAANAATDLEFENDINGTFDMGSFVQQQALNMVLSDGDHYCSANWNFYMYQDPTNNRWYMLPWDYDLSFGAQGDKVDDPANPSRMYSDGCLLTKRMLEIPKLKKQYQDAVCNIMKTELDSTWINLRIDTLTTLIATEVENDPHFWNISDFQTYLDQTYDVQDPIGSLDGATLTGIREYMNERYADVVQNLQDEGYTCDLTTDVTVGAKENNPINILNMNLSQITLNVKEDDLDSGSLKVFNILGEYLPEIKSKKINENKIQIDFSSVNSGLYFIEINGSINKFYKK